MVFGDLGLQLQRAVEVLGVLIQIIGAPPYRYRRRARRRSFPERDHTDVQHKLAVHA